MPWAHAASLHLNSVSHRHKKKTIVGLGRLGHADLATLERQVAFDCMFQLSERDGHCEANPPIHNIHLSLSQSAISGVSKPLYTIITL